MSVVSIPGYDLKPWALVHDGEDLFEVVSVHKETFRQYVTLVSETTGAQKDMPLMQATRGLTLAKAAPQAIVPDTVAEAFGDAA